MFYYYTYVYFGKVVERSGKRIKLNIEVQYARQYATMLYWSFIRLYDDEARHSLS